MFCRFVLFHILLLLAVKEHLLHWKDPDEVVDVVVDVVDVDDADVFVRFTSDTDNTSSSSVFFTNRSFLFIKHLPILHYFWDHLFHKEITHTNTKQTDSSLIPHLFIYPSISQAIIHLIYVLLSDVS